MLNEMLSRKANITIQGETAIIDKPVVLYRGDRNIKVKFTITENPYSSTGFFKVSKTNVIEENNISYGRLVIKRENGLKPLTTDIAATEEGAIILTIKKEMIDEIAELGAYDFHLVLYNENKTSKATLPAVEGGIIIKEPIEVINETVIGGATVEKGEDLPVFDSSGNYIKNNWEEGTLIDSGKMNKIENAIHENSSQIKDFENKFTDINIMCPPLEWGLEGLKGNYDVEDTGKLKAIVDKIKSLKIKTTLIFPQGRFLLSETIYVPEGVSLKGCGRNDTIIKKNDFLGPLFYLNKDGIQNGVRNYNVSFENIQLISSNSYQEGGAIFIENSPRIVIKNVLINNFNGNGITFWGTCFYAHLDTVFINYCSSSSKGYYENSDEIPDVINAGFSGSNLRCALIDFTSDGIDSRSGNWATATADLTTINCNFEANDVGVRWQSADSHFMATVFQGNAVNDFISEGSTNFTECHFETDKLNNKKMADYCLLISKGSAFLTNCNFWGNNSTSNAIAGIKTENCYYLNIIGGRSTGFSYAIDSTSLTRLYSIGNDFTSKNRSGYVNGTIDRKVILNHSVGGLRIDDGLVFGPSGYVSGNIVPQNTKSGNIGTNDKKFQTVNCVAAYMDKMFISSSVTISYNSSNPNGSLSATKGSICLTPNGLYVREGGNYTDTVWVLK